MILTIIIAVVAGWILWIFLERKREAKQNKRDDERIQKEKEATQEAELIKNHTSDLTGVIQLWQQKLPKIELAEETGNPNKFHEFDISFINGIETHFLFKVGDVFYHCDNLTDIWDDFKNSITDYQSEKQKLFNTIKEHTKQELKNWNFNIESEIIDGFYVSVYRSAITDVKGEISAYDYYYDPTLIQHKVEEGLKYQLEYCHKAESGGFLPNNVYNLAETSTQERLKDVEGVHKKLIKECKNMYSAEIHGLIKLESETTKRKKELDDALETITNLTVFPHMVSLSKEGNDMAHKEILTIERDITCRKCGSHTTKLLRNGTVKSSSAKRIVLFSRSQPLTI